MPGLLDFLNPQSQGLGAQPQQGLGFMGRAASFRDQNPGALTALGAGIMSGNPAAGFAAAAPVIAQGKRQNAMAQYLIKKGLATDPEEAMTLAQNPEIMNLILKGDDIISAGKGRLYNKTKGTWLSDPMLGPGGSVDYSQIPQYIRKEDGSYGIGVLGDNGTFKDVDLGGAQPLGPYGTSLDKAEGAAVGKDSGESKSLLASMKSKMPGLLKSVSDLSTLAKQATYTPGGQLIDTAMRWMDMEPRDAAVARTKYMAAVDTQILPLLRDTFGAQFTEREGDALKATLGAGDKTPPEKQAVLDAFIQQKYRDIEALELRTAPEQAPPAAQTIPAPGGGGGAPKIIGGKAYIQDANGDWYEQ